MKLTTSEYGVLMMAINNARIAVEEGTFIDPYDNDEVMTNEQVDEMLKSVEGKLLDLYVNY